MLSRPIFFSRVLLTHKYLCHEKRRQERNLTSLVSNGKQTLESSLNSSLGKRHILNPRSWIEGISISPLRPYQSRLTSERVTTRCLSTHDSVPLVIEDAELCSRMNRSTHWPISHYGKKKMGVPKIAATRSGRRWTCFSHGGEREQKFPALDRRSLSSSHGYISFKARK